MKGKSKTTREKLRELFYSQMDNQREVCLAMLGSEREKTGKLQSENTALYAELVRVEGRRRALVLELEGKKS